MKKQFHLATLSLRIALAAGFISAVASRLSLWGKYSSGWKNFLDYTAQVNSFAPKSIIPFLAVASTVLETAIALFLIIGYKTRIASVVAAILTLFFGLAMAFSFGVKEPLDYSVFAASAGAFLLSAMPEYKYSIDDLLFKNANE
ncbi:MAG: DoxX family protein [Bacteroidetes bacterium]|nr:DoxX family protein [Bacteroidota bacterium]